MANVNRVDVLQGAATANGTGASADVAGFRSTLVEVRETAGGAATATVTLNGSFDGSNWYAVGYQQVDATATPARAVTGIAVTASVKHVYQVLDQYPQLQAVLSAVANSAAVTVKAYSSS